jgi:CheY-like chemotaxis protein
LNIVNDVLDLSKIESNKIEVNPRVVSVASTAREVSDALLPVIKANHNSFEIIIADDLGNIFTDPAKLTQILSNLLSNAGNYTDHGRVRLSVSRKQHDDDVFFEFNVSDTGIGIADDMLEKIFLPFERADMTMTRRYGGTGLGLAISRKLAGLLGGVLTVESEIGKGSTFSLCLPQGVEQLFAQSNAEQSLSARIIPKSILVAEDHPMISEVFKRILEFDGHTVSIAHDGEEALEFLDKQHYDIGLIDVHMPKIDGVDVIRRYIEDHPHSQTTLYILTADITDTLRAAAAEMGVVIIQKPIDRQNLGRFVNH